jgi:DNA-directed RNA polymerase subunit K/omega
MMGGRPMVDNPQARKTTRIAEEELQKGLLEYETKDPVDGSEDKDKDGKRRK